MNNIKASFEDVADWCEKHLEAKRGREIGMTFGAMLRAYGRLATLPSRHHGEKRSASERQLNAKAEELLRALSARLLATNVRVDQKIKPLQPTSMCVNMIYDTVPKPKD